MWQCARGKWLVLLLLTTLVSSGLCVTVSHATSTQIKTDICDDFAGPTITSPTTSTVEASSVSVEGTGEPAMTVIIKDNGSEVGSTVVAGDGTYALMVPLTVGDNQLIASIANACQTKSSASVTVQRPAPPEPPSPPNPSNPDAGTGSSTTPGTSGGQSSSSGGNGQTTSPISSAPPIGQTRPPISHTPGFPRPFITQPNDEVTLSQRATWIVGRATPFSVVTIYVNGVATANVLTNDMGEFATKAQLRFGKNTIQVRAAFGKKVAFSDSITVYVTRPESFFGRYLFILLLFIPFMLLLIMLLYLYWKHRKRTLV